jgi:hypothetical protein
MITKSLFTLLFLPVLLSKSFPPHRPSHSSKVLLPRPLPMLPSSLDLLCWRRRLQLTCPQRTKCRQACSRRHHQQQHRRNHHFKQQLEAARRLFLKKRKNAAASSRGFLGPGSRTIMYVWSYAGAVVHAYGDVVCSNCCCRAFTCLMICCIILPAHVMLSLLRDVSSLYTV